MLDLVVLFKSQPETKIYHFHAEFIKDFYGNYALFLLYQSSEVGLVKKQIPQEELCLYFIGVGYSNRILNVW